MGSDPNDWVTGVMCGLEDRGWYSLDGNLETDIRDAVEGLAERIVELEDQLRLANIDAANALAERNDMEAEVERLRGLLNGVVRLLDRSGYQMYATTIAAEAGEGTDGEY